MFTITNFFKNRRFVLFVVIVILIVSWSIASNINASAMSYLIGTNSSFLIYTNSYMILFYLRSRIYEKLRNLSIIRITLDHYIKEILRLEVKILFIFFIMLYVVLGMILGINNFLSYSIFVLIYLLVYLFVILYFGYTLYTKNNLNIPLIVSYALFIFYNYWIKDMIFNVLALLDIL